MASRCLVFSFTQLTQVLLDGKVSFTNPAAAKTRHFLRPLHVGGVIPGQLGAGLHDSDRGGKDERLVKTRQEKRKKKPSSSSPAGEEGDDGEGGVVGVREDVLEEEVGLAAVLQGEGGGANVNVRHVSTKKPLIT